VNATTLSWTIALFFGCSIAFAAIRRATEDSGAGVTLLAQAAFLALVVGGIVWFMKRRENGDDSPDP
jgi:hypothetical protein